MTSNTTPIVLDPEWVTQAGLLGSINELENYSTTLVAVDPQGHSLSFSLVAGTLPSGLSLSAAGDLAGTPPAVGADTSSTFTIRVTNTDGKFADREFSLVVLDSNPSPAWITAAGSLGSVLERQPASFAIQASDPGGSVASYGVKSGSIDPLSLNSTTGAITGTAPLVSGTALTSTLSFTATATDDAGQVSPDRSFDITVRASDPYLNQTSLLLDFEGADRSTKLIDRSIMGRARLAGGGNPLLSSQAKFGPTSLNIGSAGTYTQYSDPGNDLNFGTGDFTIEFWSYVTSIPSGLLSSVFARRASTATYGNIILGFRDGTLRLYASSNGSSWDVASILDISGPVTLGKWTHFAISRQGSTFRTFMDGVQKATFTSSASLYGAASSFSIGGENGNTTATTANFQDFRIYRSAKYTSNFAVPTALLPNNDNDPNWDTCVFAGQYSTDLEDKKGRRVTLAGTATISTAQARAGSSSLYFDGSLNSYAAVAMHPALDFRGTDFTVEGWVKPEPVGGNPTVGKFLFDTRTNNSFHSPLGVIQWDDGKLGLYASSNGTSWDVVSNGNVATLTTNQWQHIAVVRWGTYLRLYLNGTKVSETITSAVLTANTAGMYFGGLPTNTNASGYKGWMDGVRVTGYARYTADFTPKYGNAQEDAVYDPAWSSVATRMRFDAANGSYTFTDDAKPARTFGRVTSVNGVYVSTASSKFGSSSLAFGQGGIGYLIDQADDDNLDFGSGDFTIEGWTNLTGTPQGTSSVNNALLAKWWGNYQGTPQNSWYIGYTNTLFDFEFYTVSNTNINNQSLSIAHPGLNRWFHFAVVRYGASIYFYINGIRQSGTINIGSTAMKNSIAPLSIGGYTAYNVSTPTNYTGQGFVDDVRITKGLARYTGPMFVVPTLALPLAA